MRRVRRHSPEVRLEVMPLLDVVFLLLTFFIFSLVLMVRADVLRVRPPVLEAGETATGGQTITVAIDEENRVFLNGEQAELDVLAERLRALREASPEARIFVAADERSSSGVLIGVVDRLVGSGIDDFSVMGRPGGPSPPAAGGPAPPDAEALEPGGGGEGSASGS